MARLNPTASWMRSRPEVVKVEQPGADVALVVTPEGSSHLTIAWTSAQARALADAIGNLLAISTNKS